MKSTPSTRSSRLLASSRHLPAISKIYARIVCPGFLSIHSYALSASSFLTIPVSNVFLPRRAPCLRLRSPCLSAALSYCCLYFFTSAVHDRDTFDRFPSPPTCWLTLIHIIPSSHYYMFSHPSQNRLPLKPRNLACPTIVLR